MLTRTVEADRLRGLLVNLEREMRAVKDWALILHEPLGETQPISPECRAPSLA